MYFQLDQLIRKPNYNRCVSLLSKVFKNRAGTDSDAALFLRVVLFYLYGITFTRLANRVDYRIDDISSGRLNDKNTILV